MLFVSVMHGQANIKFTAIYLGYGPQPYSGSISTLKRIQRYFTVCHL